MVWAAGFDCISLAQVLGVNSLDCQTGNDYMIVYYIILYFVVLCYSMLYYIMLYYIIS